MGFKIKNGVLEKYKKERGVTEVIIPDSVTSIGDWAFSGCSSLTSITIPDSVTSIGNNAFYGTKWLNNHPDDLVLAGSVLVTYKGNSTSVTIPDSVTSIGYCAFSGCSRLTSITIPDSVTSIGYCAFRGCSRLTSITIPNSVTSIGREAFYNCSRLTNITIPNSVTSIDNSTFSDCSNLTSITIPDSVTSIGNWAFSGCSNLTSIIIPDSVTDICEEAFCNCSKLKDFSIPTKKQLLTKDVFGNKLPSGLTDKAMYLSSAMKDLALKQYILTKAIWKTFSAEDQFTLFMTRQSKSCLPAFIKLIDKETTSYFAERMLVTLNSKSSAKECNAVAAFILSFSTVASVDILKKLYTALKNCKNSTKATANIEKDIALLTKLTEATVEMSGIERMTTDIMTSKKISVTQLEKNFQNFYSLMTKSLPEIKDTDGNAIPDYVFAYLMTAHEQNNACSEVFPKYTKAGIRPEITPIIEKIDQESFQSALKKITDDNLGVFSKSKKMYLVYPICRYADDKLVEYLISISAKWNSSERHTFYSAIIYNNSRAVMFFAEKHKELDDYASIRNTTADVLRDKYMSYAGFETDGTKTYDLGNQTVTLRVLPDLSFAFTTAAGKVAKSVPKRGSDPEKYAVANADFSEIKKITTSRLNFLFEAFLNEKKQPAKDWMESYLNKPLLRQIASLLVWCQDKNTFTIGNDGPIDSNGNAYTISEKVPICVAHPMKMTSDDVRAWQKYFSDNKLKQPFLQVWEPVADAEKIKPDRYDGIEIPFEFLLGGQKHGITINYGYNDVTINIPDCEVKYDFIEWYSISRPEKVEFSNFRISKFNRKSNHIISLLDKWTVSGRIAKDDISVADVITNATLAQLTYYINVAGQNNATNCMALLLDLKNKNYPDFDPMEEYSLD